ncbi:hypothetical protein QBC35DRAFT_470408 [Podospora australis]|uniref:Uncharacterized protein n=1 Tax=Podospora australis TaxID=1536484 RepID=A0AAN6X1R6_9PEZI|nr:hypothetical protein QBC35DRAFT_470408 [Podospora australis]
MCIQEYLHYQCGHRSLLNVLRPCPATTARHNFPVCSQQPPKTWIAETMCAGCERELHSRWVLIREWEHRWLHERGACGCEVQFQGLLYMPRIIGGTTAGGSGSEARFSSSSQKPGGGGVEGLFDSGKGKGKARAIATVDVTRGGDGPVPPLYSETITPDGQSHVQIRLSSLMAAEWIADHRKLHEAEKCRCPVDFPRLRPPPDDLTEADRETLSWWRELVAEREGSAPAESAMRTKDENAETAQRIKQINEIFGSFDTPKGTKETKPIMRLPRPSASLPAPAIPHGPANPLYRHYNSADEYLPRTHTSRRTRPATTHHQSQARDFVLTNHHPSSLGEDMWRLQDFTPEPLTHGPPPHQHPYQQRTAHFVPAAEAITIPSPSPSSEPAFPEYATFRTYTNAIPFGACPWEPCSRRIRGLHGAIDRGPGPFRSPGFNYDADALDSSPDLPICGLPIGAGPDGYAQHLPPWEQCPLYLAADPNPSGGEASSKHHQQQQPTTPSPSRSRNSGEPSSVEKQWEIYPLPTSSPPATAEEEGPLIQEWEIYPRPEPHHRRHNSSIGFLSPHQYEDGEGGEELRRRKSASN